LLESQLREAIEADLDAYPTRRAACVEAMLHVQREHGWVSDAHLRDIAHLLDMSPAELDAVATFYNLIHRRPVGRRVVLACDSVSCWLCGADALARALKERLGIGFGETTDDGAFTLLPICCLGACDHAPVLIVGETLHHDVGPDDLERVLDGEAG